MGRRAGGSHPGRPRRPQRHDSAIGEIRRRLEGGALHALVNNAAISPKADGGRRLGTIETDVDTWSHVFRVNFFAPIMMARGLIEELKTAKGSVVDVTSIAGGRVHPFAAPPTPPQGGIVANPGTGSISAATAFASTPRARRDRHRDPLPRHREDRRGRYPFALARHAR